jgi:hypothetical protein
VIELFPAMKSLRNTLARARQQRGDPVEEDDIFEEAPDKPETEKIKPIETKKPVIMSKPGTIIGKPKPKPKEKEKVAIVPKKPLNLPTSIPKKLSAVPMSIAKKPMLVLKKREVKVVEKVAEPEASQTSKKEEESPETVPAEPSKPP